jgi:hypothetical protein
MAGIVLRVRLMSGDHLDVRYDNPEIDSQDEIADIAIAALSDNMGVLRCTHGDRLLVLYARGVAAIEVAPRGAVL